MAYGEPLPGGVWERKESRLLAMVWPVFGKDRSRLKIGAETKAVCVRFQGRTVFYPLDMFYARFRHYNGPSVDWCDFDY